MDSCSPHRQRSRVIEVCTDLLNVTPPVTELGLRPGRTIPCSLSTHHFTHCIFFTHSWVFHHHTSTYKRKASLLFRSTLACQWWYTPLIPGFGSHIQMDIWVWGQFGLESDFQKSQSYKEKLCLWKKLEHIKLCFLVFLSNDCPWGTS